jgi:hypothetical protein
MRRWWRPATSGLVAVTALVTIAVLFTPYDESKPAPVGYGYAALGLFVACAAAGVMTLVLGQRAWRDHRRAHGHLTKAEQAELARRTSTLQAHRTGWMLARQLTRQLIAGEPLQLLTVWGLVFHDGEQVHIDTWARYARYYRGDGSYQHISGMFFGHPAFVISGLAFTALNNASRRRQAAAEARTRWREHQPARVIATTERLICQVNGQWLSFYFNAVTAFYPEPHNYSVVFEFPDTSPLQLVGPGAPLLAVYSAWRLHGPAAISEHPALATLRT